MGLDSRTGWLTDHKSQCDFEFDFSAVEGSIGAGIGSGRLSIAKIRYQETSSEDIAEE
jgi:hypothetical protein